MPTPKLMAARKGGNPRTMSTHRRRIVQMLNPVPGGCQYTTYKSARHVVMRSRAVLEADGSAIRLTDSVPYPQIGGSRGAEEGVFRCHRGNTGGMAQVLGSTLQQPSRTPKFQRPVKHARNRRMHTAKSRYISHLTGRTGCFHIGTVPWLRERYRRARTTDGCYARDFGQWRIS